MDDMKTRTMTMETNLARQPEDPASVAFGGSELRELIESLRCRQLWAGSAEMLFETPMGNFAYSSGEYGGDNALRPFLGGAASWLAGLGMDECRDKGARRLGDRLWPGWRFEAAPVEF